tara:strand:+ start:34 stop:276 length:243 start_codon:yes stop_codon:yes gene_type:complete
MKKDVIPLKKFMPTTLLAFWFFYIFACDREINRETTRPNILFVMSDDHAFQAISAYSQKLIQTPNIDKIAKRGAISTMLV